MPYRYLLGTRCTDCAGSGKVLIDLAAVGFAPDQIAIREALGHPIRRGEGGRYLGNEYPCLGCDGRGQQRVMED